MKNTILVFIALCILVAGCKKKESAVPQAVTPNSNDTVISSPPLLVATEYNGNLIVGGVAGDGGKYNSGIAQWNGTSWSTLGSGLQGGSISALITYNGNLIAAGVFESIGGVKVNNIAQWNGTSWSPLGSAGTDRSPSNMVSSLAIYNGNLIATGEFDSIGKVRVNGIAQWNGSTWSALGNGLGFEGAGTALVIYNNNLIVTGEFDTAGTKTINNIAQWNGVTWDTVPLAYEVTGPGGTSAVLYNANLVVWSMDSMSEWNGTRWEMIDKGVVTQSPLYPMGGNEMLSYNGKLMVCYGGTVKAWNGASWSTLGVFPGTYRPPVGPTAYSYTDALTVYNGNLVVCGFFAPNNVAIYNGSSFTFL